MLEVRELTKIYRPKKGLPVTALAKVSIAFPETGMVFLVGKSGSGKSTLLNLIGGLDRYDGGDILINGNSTRDFKQGDFDSYRNTFVGFVFQEYNVLEEFTVGANIALALELQGKKATDEAINAILEQVDLSGYGARRPNELSGGQLQRVAIARALVKNPKIIMADEPTGALDSVTGKAVLESLKKLSAEKLVIVVSHDRDFALRYADRIIELSDGAVLSDREYFSAPQENAAAGLRYQGNVVTLPQGYHLTEEDRAQINAYMDAQASDLALTILDGQGAIRESRETPAAPERPRGPLSLIRSRLPIRSAARIGAGALKFKKFRLAVTILLSCVAFLLFGLADTFGSYNHVETCTRSILDTGVGYASLIRQERKETDKGAVYWERSYPSVSEEDLMEIEAETGIKVQGVYVPGNVSLGFDSQYDAQKGYSDSEYYVYAYGISGFATMEENALANNGLTLAAGHLPEQDDQIAIPAYLCELFLVGGYRAPDADPEGPYAKIKNYGDMVDKVLRLAGRDYVVSGVVDTGMDLERYLPLTVPKEGDQSTAEALKEYALSSELNNLRSYSFAQVVFVTEGAMKSLREEYPALRYVDNGSFNLEYDCAEEYCCGLWADRIGRLSDCGACEIRWLDGERAELGDKEVVVSPDLLRDYLGYTWEDSEDYQASLSFTDEEWEAIAARLEQEVFRGSFYLYGEDPVESQEDGWRIVGVLCPDDTPFKDLVYSAFLVPDRVYEQMIDRTEGIYEFAVGAMPADSAGIRQLVSFCEEGCGDHRFALQNSVTFELDSVHEILAVLGRVFFWIGFGFAVFAAIMLSNFIATSIAYKKQEIGILRAIGARGNDVFRIFFSESFIIASVNFLLSALGTFFVTTAINGAMRTRVGILVTVLPFGLRQVILLFAVSMAVAALASFIPVKRIAGKRPIDAIRNR